MNIQIQAPEVAPVARPPESVVRAKAPELSHDERARLRERARALLVECNAVLLAHYYTDEDLQTLAEQSGGCVADSLEMARFGTQHPATTIVVSGVRFMGETAKILNPEKRVLMPELDATCSLDVGCPVDDFSRFCDAHSARTVVVYANTSAAVKARADWVVTSSIALPVIEHLKSYGEKILWAPDRYLGDYVQRMTGADMLLWQGSCIVHESFKAAALQGLRAQHPDAVVLVHPESPPGVIDQADVVGSTTQLIEAVKNRPAQRFIVATDRGIFHKMRQVAAGKILMEAPTAGKGATCESCAHCPWMAMNSLENLVRVLETGHNEIRVDPHIRERAVVPLERMLAFSRERAVHLEGNA